MRFWKELPRGKALPSMAKDINLKIYMPERCVVDTQIYRVVLPGFDKPLTVIKDRAPTLLPLNMGIIKVLDENDNVTDEYFTADGAVDIKDNICTILTEAAFHQSELSLEKARELYNEFNNVFYEWLVKYFEEKR